MNKNIFVNILMCFLFAFLQAFVIDKINISIYFYPFIYFLPLMLINYKTPPYLMLIFAFLNGLLMDILSGSLGLHSFSFVMMMLFRNAFVKYSLSDTKYDYADVSLSSAFSFSKFLTYIAISVFIYHTSFFIMEALSFTNIKVLLYQIICSSVVSLLLLLLINNITSKK